MNRPCQRFMKFILFTPIIGMLVFLILYIVSTFQYPGGSYEAILQSDFSWQHNFLCDLLDARAINGEENPANITSRIALGLLCLGIIILWYFIPYLFPKNKLLYVTIRFTGISSMGTVLFLAYGNHDIVVRIAGALATIALLLTFYALYRSKHYKLLGMGIVALLLVATNFYIYETSNGRYWLAILQKITFLVCMVWFTAINIKLIKILGK